MFIFEVSVLLVFNLFLIRKQSNIKTEYRLIVYELHDSDVIIFVILFANSSDDTGLMW